MSSMMINSEETKGVEAKDDDSSYMTIGEAARYLGVGRKIVYQLIDFGRIQAGRRRQMILVERYSLEEFRRSGRIT